MNHKKFILKTKNLTEKFGGLTAVNSVEIFVEEGKITSLIGPNGSGKTTLFNMITGFLQPTEGDIYFEDKNITGLKPFETSKIGITRTFQQVETFPELSVEDCIIGGMHNISETGLLSIILKRKSRKENFKEEIEKILELTNLIDKKRTLAKNLSHGELKMLQIAIGLATSPRILLLDEPVGGVSSAEIEKVLKLIKKFKEDGLTIFMIEHNMRAVMDISDYIFVMNYGNKIAEGPPEKVQKDPHTIEAYLGGGYHAKNK
ncbi:Lipopolysaccharide export system ATP-binding protein LptB [subsurface metagenome]|nr:ATP-binding cassette domain-containing protein [Clostridia bacterium]